MRTCDAALAKIEYLTAVVGGSMIFLMMWVGVREIVGRKLFNSPLFGQLDFIEQTMSVYALLTVSFCWRQSGHIRMELMIDRFEGRRRHVFELITSIAALALITGILPGVYHFMSNALEIGDSTIDTRFPTWPSKMVPVVGFGLLWLRILLEVFGYMRLIADPTAEPIAIPERHNPIDEFVHEAERD